jgi:hypothetical protein
MGAWGSGLYSSDFALDLRGAVKAVARLPFPPDKLLGYLCASQPAAANDPQDADHTVFWLTVADQFAKRGIDCAAARDRALAIITGGVDVAAMAALGMDEKSLAKRRAMLEELRGRIAAPIDAAKPRAVLKAPQKLLLEVGEVSTYPVCKGAPINPYTVGKDWAFVKAWQQDGWGACVVVELGHVFDFLAWYRPLVITEPMPDEPDLAELARPRLWLLREPGTLTLRHHANMALKSLGRVPVDPARLAERFPRRGSAVSSAVNDISLCNNLTVRPLDLHEAHRVKHAYPPTPRIELLADLAGAETAGRQ